VKTIAEIQQQEGIPAKQACQAAGVPYSTFRRWETRLDAGLIPVCEPGPKPTGPLELDQLMEYIRRLHHGRRRTQGTGELYEEFRDGISRRDLQKLVAQVRDSENEARDLLVRHFEWNHPGYIWATDTTEVVVGGKKHYVQTIRDLASRYTIAPCLDHVPTDEEVAQILEKQFRRHGAPLFLKRDNGSNENGPAVKRVLAKWLVIPINSPVAYPQYNGGGERAQDEIQKGLAALAIPFPCHPAHAAAYVGLVAHELNHNPRSCLEERCSCELFHHGKRRDIVTRRQRKEVAEELARCAVVILAEIEAPTERQTQKAWRLAVEEWLLKNGQIKEKNLDVLPSFLSQKSS
jgi:transposase InsO family protein